MLAQEKIKNTLTSHWFFLAALAVVAADLAVTLLDDWTNPRVLEAGVLFDLSVVIPAMYLWCYRSRGKAAVVRAIALSCLGIWVAGHVVPNEHHQILSTVGFARYIGLAVLIAIEIKLVVMILRATFRRDSEPSTAVLATAKDAGMPEWAARLMAWEASLWRKAWDAIRRLVSRS